MTNTLTAVNWKMHALQTTAVVTGCVFVHAFGCKYNRNRNKLKTCSCVDLVNSLLLITELLIHKYYNSEYKFYKMKPNHSLNRLTHPSSVSEGTTFNSLFAPVANSHIILHRTLEAGSKTTLKKANQWPLLQSHDNRQWLRLLICGVFQHFFSLSQKKVLLQVTSYNDPTAIQKSWSSAKPLEMLTVGQREISLVADAANSNSNSNPEQPNMIGLRHAA